MNHYPHITPQEADCLAKLYLECRLTRLQEAELEYILASQPYDSPNIRQVRSIMTPILTLSTATRPSQRHAKSSHQALRILNIAAAVAILICAATLWVYIPNTHQSDVSYTEVYINGTSLAPEKAELYARRIEAASMALLLHTQLSSQSAQQQALTDMNHILNTQ